MEKKEFVETVLKDVVMKTDPSISNVSYEEVGGEEYVRIQYGEDFAKMIIVTGDSLAAILVVVAIRLL